VSGLKPDTGLADGWERAPIG